MAMRGNAGRYPLKEEWGCERQQLSVSIIVLAIEGEHHSASNWVTHTFIAPDPNVGLHFPFHATWVAANHSTELPHKVGNIHCQAVVHHIAGLLLGFETTSPFYCHLNHIKAHNLCVVVVSKACMVGGVCLDYSRRYLHVHGWMVKIIYVSWVQSMCLFIGTKAPLCECNGKGTTTRYLCECWVKGVHMMTKSVACMNSLYAWCTLEALHHATPETPHCA